MGTGWWIGGNGVYGWVPGDRPEARDPYRYVVNAILPRGDGLVVACGNGLWQVPADTDERWLQLHDETLTEVLTVVDTPAGLVAGSPYGVAVSRVDDAGSPRWTSLTEDASPNARFTNVVAVDPDDRSRWLVGKEGGVCVAEENGGRIEESDLMGTPVRALVASRGGWLAGTDDRGLMRSEDGTVWDGVDGVDGAVFSVAEAGSRLVAGTDRGVVVVEADGRVWRCGPSILVRCLAVDPENEGVWVAGADPGGLWWTEDRGVTWRSNGDVRRVRCIVAREDGA